MFLSHMAESSGVIFFNVDYRLAPEAKCPENVKDFYSALKYVVSRTCFLDALASLETTQVSESVSESVSRNFAKVTWAAKVTILAHLRGFELVSYLQKIVEDDDETRHASGSS